MFLINGTQTSFVCSKSTIEALKKVMTMFKGNNKDTNYVNGIALVPLLLTFNIFSL